MYYGTPDILFTYTSSFLLNTVLKTQDKKNGLEEGWHLKPV